MQTVKSITEELNAAGVKTDAGMVRTAAKAKGFTLARGRKPTEFNSKDADKIKSAVKAMVNS
jgi:hypothetical protein